MGNFFGGIFAGTLLIWLAICTIFVPALVFNSWIAKRDCQLLHGQDCYWVMLPAGGQTQ